MKKNLAKRFKDIDPAQAAIVVSPMRRTIETAQISLKWLIDKGVQLEADARWQGMTLGITRVTTAAHDAVLHRELVQEV